VAHVLVSKYAWHLTLYRQAQMLKSQGIVIERMTLAAWVGYAAAELAPVVARLVLMIKYILTVPLNCLCEIFVKACWMPR
jgi:transposase